MVGLNQCTARMPGPILLLSITLAAQVSCAPPHLTQPPASEPARSSKKPPVNLEGKEQVFVEQDLTGAVFDRRRLAGFRFDGCSLRNASFRDATLSGMLMSDCVIAGADFTDAVINGLQPSNALDESTWVFLSERQLMSTRSYKTRDLRNCLISGNGKYDFGGADLRGATLMAGDFSRCDFTDARIEELEFLGSGTTYVSGNELLNESLSPASGEEYDGDRVLSGGGLKTAQLCSTRSYRERRLVGISFRLADLRNCDFSGIDLTGSRFIRCDLRGADFRDAVISDVHFAAGDVGDSQITVDQIKKSWNYQNDQMQSIVFPQHVAEQF